MSPCWMPLGFRVGYILSTLRSLKVKSSIMLNIFCLMYIVHRFTKGKTQFRPSMYLRDRSAKCRGSVCDLLADHFSSVSILIHNISISWLGALRAMIWLSAIGSTKLRRLLHFLGSTITPSLDLNLKESLPTFSSDVKSLQTLNISL